MELLAKWNLIYLLHIVVSITFQLLLYFHHTLKESAISPLLKKPTLDKNELSNYQPISNLSRLLNLIEHIVKACLYDHLTSNNLLNPH